MSQESYAPEVTATRRPRNGGPEVPAHAQRVYSFRPGIIETEHRLPDVAAWLNKPEGPRAPGPFPLPEPNTLQWGTGFPRDLPKPILRFDKGAKQAAKLSDAYYFDGQRWPVSPRLRKLLVSLDPGAFDSIEASTRFRDGVAGPTYYLIDPVRFVDAIDYDASAARGVRLEMPIPESRRTHLRVNPLGTAMVCFDAARLGNVLFWRQPGCAPTLCSERAKQAVEGEGFSNLSFLPFGWCW